MLSESLLNLAKIFHFAIIEDPIGMEAFPRPDQDRGLKRELVQLPELILKRIVVEVYELGPSGSPGSLYFLVSMSSSVYNVEDPEQLVVVSMQSRENRIESRKLYFHVLREHFVSLPIVEAPQIHRVAVFIAQSVKELVI
jgi:hypothetical protein